MNDNTMKIISEMPIEVITDNDAACQGIADIKKAINTRAMNGRKVSVYDCILKGFLWGYVCGKRAERERRKKA